MLDLIKPKLVYLDLPLFMALLSDLFPGVELPNNDGGILRVAIEAELRENNLQASGASVVVPSNQHAVFLSLPVVVECVALQLSANLVQRRKRITYQFALSSPPPTAGCARLCDQDHPGVRLQGGAPRQHDRRPYRLRQVRGMEVPAACAGTAEEGGPRGRALPEGARAHHQPAGAVQRRDVRILRRRHRRVAGAARRGRRQRRGWGLLQRSLRPAQL